MPAADHRVLAVNPGSTSTKFGLYAQGALAKVWTLRHDEADLAPFKGKPVLAQEEYRLGLILSTLDAEGISLDGIDAFVGRGGMLRPMVSGTYRVNDVMIGDLRRAMRGDHASNLGAILADRLARANGAPAFIVDPISVNERAPVARLSGSPAFERGPFCHALNSKAVAKRFATEEGKSYGALRLVVAHLGGGICISAHADGLMIDATDAQQEGPFSPERSGSVPVYQLAQLCFDGRHQRHEVEAMLMGNGGMRAYLGTADLREVERRIADGDETAALVFDAMAYQIAKEIAGMAAAALEGRLDAVLLTGGMAYSERLIAAVTRRIAWIGRIAIFPGEEELVALSEGVVRVLSGEEVARVLEPLPAA